MMTAELHQPNVYNAKKFAMWLGIAAIIMFFAALTSAYIVRESQGGAWKNIHLPLIFWFNTAIIILSSITIQWSVNAFKKYQRNAYRLGLLVTFLLGCIFLVGQIEGWNQMPSLGKNIAGDYVLAISYAHAAHIAGGLFIMIFNLAIAFFKPFNPNKLTNAQIMATYWHFVDGLWIYLFLFFQLKL